jgi:poly [ADP-ribose] polymerase
MLNQTNISQNNNKFYLLQLLQNDNSKEFYTWFRWGRVGENGQSDLKTFDSNLSQAKATFGRKFSVRRLDFIMNVYRFY